MEDSVRFVALGGALNKSDSSPRSGIGGSAYALLSGDSALIVDFGSYLPPPQVRTILSKRIISDKAQNDNFEMPANFNKLPNLEFLMNYRSITLVVTHAHNEHVGALPVFARIFPWARIMMTRQTYEIASWLWEDTLKVEERQEIEGSYDARDVFRLRKNIRFIGFADNFKAGPFWIRTFSAGHILGSISLLVNIRGRKIFFTGDFSMRNQRTVQASSVFKNSYAKADVLVTETTNAAKGSIPPRHEVERKMVGDIETVMLAGGKFLLAAPAIGRAQEVYRILDAFGITRRYRVYVDGSARRISDVYLRAGRLPESIVRKYVSDSYHRFDLFSSRSPYVVITPSGMFSGGPILGYAERFLGSSQNALGFTCWQDPYSPGAALLKTPIGKEIRLNKEWLKLEAGVVKYDFSTHPTAREIRELTNYLKAKTVLMIHGEEAGMDELQRLLPSAQKVWVGESIKI